MMNKNEMRRVLRARFESQTERQAQSAELCRHILSSTEYRNACVIGAYIPMPKEADIMPVLQDALMHGKRLAVPLCAEAPEMRFHLVSSLTELRAGKYGILQPSSEAPIIAVEEMDLMLVPLEGIDPAGCRLGKGGGYYDKALSGQSVMTMGCALTWQWAAKVPCDPWDVRLYACADKRGVHVFKTETI